MSAELRRRFDEKMRAREEALPAARQAIRSSANAIRAIHRGDSDEARRLMEEARAALDAGETAVRDHPDVRHAGFLHDGQKEYAEARLTEAVVSGTDLPGPDELRVTVPAYLNGMAEAIGEARRAVLDRLRAGEVSRAEELLQAMDDLFDLLVTIDYPDAITGHLRRSTDVARSIIEKTRGDLSVSIVQKDLRDALERHAAEFRDRP
ncbi:MAG: haloacid dehalogenase [Actinomycetota bacterium]